MGSSARRQDATSRIGVHLRLSAVSTSFFSFAAAVSIEIGNADGLM